MKHDDSFQEVLDILSVLKEIDLAICPIVPTQHMCEAGAKIGDISPEMAKKVYVAMLLNSQNLQKDERFRLH